MSVSPDNAVEEVAAILRRVLQLAPQVRLDAQTQLLGGIPEFDSLAVASVVMALEDEFAVGFDDEDISAEMFATVGTLAAAVARTKTAAASAVATGSGGVRPYFLTAPSGRLFVLRRDPPGGPGSRCVLFVPPFAEELNRVRPLMTTAAVALNAAGLSTCLGDLHGTGDSDGDFADARWTTWLDDLQALVGHLHSSGFSAVDLVAVRLGARLAFDYCHRHPGDTAQIVLWDPLLDGARFLDRFLRTRTMAAMMSGASESVASLRARLGAGETVEVGGYALHPDLAAQLADDGAASGMPGVASPVRCMVRAQTAQTDAAMRRLGLDPAAVVVTGHEAYWDSVETVAARALVTATVRSLAAPES